MENGKSGLQTLLQKPFIAGEGQHHRGLLRGGDDYFRNRLLPAKALLKWSTYIGIP